VDDGLPVQSQLLVHFPSLIRLAEEAGLEYLEIQNLTEFYEDYRYVIFSL
jgi:mRNA (guanine-N7-)-methyltransferase